MARLTSIAIGAVLAGAAAAAPAAAAAAFPPPAGDPDGIALARAVNAHYSAPARLGVEVVVPASNLMQRTRMVLVRGRTEAALSFLDAPGLHEVYLNDPRGFFVRENAARCWSRNGSGGDSTDSPLITLRGSLFHPPERFGAVTRLTVLERIRGQKRHLWVSYRIDTATNRILTQQFHDVVVRYRTLPRPPRMPRPTPRCG
jgi:hypothetical protein